MRKQLLTPLLLVSHFLIGQSLDSTLNLKDMEIPTSPGFILLDQAPSSIERPNSPQAFAISALNSFTETNGLPKNYAVEFTPFWFWKHPHMNVLKYAGYHTKKQRPFSNMRMVSFSLAYINQLDTVSLQPINNVGIGARTNIFQLRSRNNLSALEHSNSTAVTQLRNINDYIVSKLGPGDPINPEGYQQKQLELLTFFQDSLKNSIAEILRQKPLFAVDVAVAYNSFFTHNNFSTYQFGRLGTWVTLNYSQKLNKENTTYFNVYGLVRYLQDGTGKDEQGAYFIQMFYDLGGKFEIELKNFSLGYEYIYRSNSSIETYRSTGQFKYRISDNLLLTGAFGKNFGDFSNLVSMLGINWGIPTGNEKVAIE